MTDFISITEVNGALRAYREAHGEEAKRDLMISVAGTEDIRRIPEDRDLRQKLIDACAVESDQPLSLERRMAAIGRRAFARLRGEEV